MEKWAKKLNAQKEHIKEEVKAPVAEPIIDIASVALPSSSAAADAGFSMLEKVNDIRTVYSRDAQTFRARQTNFQLTVHGATSQ